MRSEEEIREEQQHNLKALKSIIASKPIVIYPASLSGNAFAPSEKHPTLRFGVAVVGDAFHNNLAELDQWMMAIVFFKPFTGSLNDKGEK